MAVYYKMFFFYFIIWLIGQQISCNDILKPPYKMTVLFLFCFQNSDTP